MDAQDTAWKIDRATSVEMAARMGCSRQAVDRHAKDNGITKGADSKYDAAKLQASMEAGRAMDKSKQPASLIENRERKLELECRHLELELEVESGRYIERARIAPAFAAVANAVKGEFLSLGARVAARCEGQPAAKIVAIINTAVNDALRHLANEPEPRAEK